MNESVPERRPARIFLGHLARGVVAWMLLWTVVFSLLRLLSPDPITVVAGIYTDAGTREHLAAQFGTAQSVFPIYIEALYRAVTLDLGLSRRSGRQVLDLLRDPFALSLLIAGIGGLVSAGAVVLTYAGAAWVGKTSPIGVARTTASVSAFPSFMLALLIARSPLPSLLGIPSHGMAEGTLSALIVPAFCVAVPALSYGILRALVAYAEVAQSTWFRAARGLGGSAFSIALVLGWPRLTLTTADVFAHGLILSLTGAVGVEFVLGIPGLGTLVMDSIQLRDDPVILGVVSAVGILTILLYFLRDMVQLLVEQA